MTFGGEKQITSAIYKLTAAGQSHAYYTTNHHISLIRFKSSHILSLQPHTAAVRLLQACDNTQGGCLAAAGST